MVLWVIRTIMFFVVRAMSGIEVAGLVLGALFLVIIGIDMYRTGVSCAIYVTSSCHLRV
jgi:hypothetical protein